MTFPVELSEQNNNNHLIDFLLTSFAVEALAPRLDEKTE